MMKSIFLNMFAVSALALMVIARPGSALAQDAVDGNTVLIANSVAKVTQAEYDVELQRLPFDVRAGFANNPRRVNELLVRMLMQKSLAARARGDKLDAVPENVLRIQMEAERLLGQIYMEKIEADAGAEFDAAKSRYEARAREMYLVDKARFERPEQLMATHILFDTKKRSAEDAKALASATRARIVAGADMGALAKELSDDPSAQTNNGKLDWFSRKEMDAKFADAVFALQKPGDLSQPVLSQFGWHVIRLDARRPAEVAPFEQARDTLMGELRKKFIDERREETIAAVRRDPQTQVNRDAVNALTPRVDVEAAKRALGMTPGVTPAPAAAPAPK
ncbi:MAG: peptidylprolyl isomerase [Betaproteobacteria bacterium]